MEKYAELNIPVAITRIILFTVMLAAPIASVWMPDARPTLMFAAMVAGGVFTFLAKYDGDPET